MTEDDNGVWSATAQLSLEKSYEYGIVVNDNWMGIPPTHAVTATQKFYAILFITMMEA